MLSNQVSLFPLITSIQKAPTTLIEMTRQNVYQSFIGYYNRRELFLAKNGAILELHPVLQPVVLLPFYKTETYILRIKTD